MGARRTKALHKFESHDGVSGYAMRNVRWKGETREDILYNHNTQKRNWIYIKLLEIIIIFFHYYYPMFCSDSLLCLAFPLIITPFSMTPFICILFCS